MSKRIMELYRAAKVKAPDGKGVHTQKFHEMAIAIKKSNPEYSMQKCYQIAMGKIGRDKSVKKSHWK